MTEIVFGLLTIQVVEMICLWCFDRKIRDLDEEIKRLKLRRMF